MRHDRSGNQSIPGAEADVAVPACPVGRHDAKRCEQVGTQPNQAVRRIQSPVGVARARRSGRPGCPAGRSPTRTGGRTAQAAVRKPREAAKTGKKETAKICSCTSRKPLQGLPPLAAHGQCEKQDHVLCLHPGDRPCPDLRRGAYIPAVQDAQSAVSGRC